ncbi:MAG: hypothetical protein ACI4TP_06355, partial [Anaerotignum sp.]
SGVCALRNKEKQSATLFCESSMTARTACPAKWVVIIVTWEGLLCVIAFASLIVEIIALMMSKKKQFLIK